MKMLGHLSWRTTLCGFIAAGLASLAASPTFDENARALFTAAAGFVTSIGLMFARDNNKTSEQVGATGGAK